MGVPSAFLAKWSQVPIDLPEGAPFETFRPSHVNITRVPVLRSDTGLGGDIAARVWSQEPNELPESPQCLRVQGSSSTWSRELSQDPLRPSWQQCPTLLPCPCEQRRSTTYRQSSLRVKSRAVPASYDAGLPLARGTTMPHTETFGIRVAHAAIPDWLACGITYSARSTRKIPE